MKDYNNLSNDDGNLLLNIARKTITQYIKNGTKLKLEKEFKDNFSFNAGVFVTLNNDLGLRGCIGYPLPNKLLYDALQDASISAATKDSRFSPVKYNELTSIIIEVTVLTPPKKIIVNNYNEYLSKIKVGKDGLIVKNKFHSGLLLPQVPVDYNWNEKEFLEHTCEKAGLSIDSWKDSSTEIEKFEGIIFKEQTK